MVLIECVIGVIYIVVSGFVVLHVCAMILKIKTGTAKTAPVTPATKNTKKTEFTPMLLSVNGVPTIVISKYQSGKDVVMATRIHKKLVGDAQNAMNFIGS